VGGRHSLMAYIQWRGRVFAAMMLGRTGQHFLGVMSGGLIEAAAAGAGRRARGVWSPRFVRAGVRTRAADAVGNGSASSRPAHELTREPART
jgi:hypothetical protein